MITATTKEPSFWSFNTHFRCKCSSWATWYQDRPW